MTVQEVLVKQLGALPVIREYLDRLQLKERVDALAPVRPVAHLTHGEVVVALVANRLTAPRPLYDIQHWAETWAVEETLGLRPSDLNDDRLGRCLDELAGVHDQLRGDLTVQPRLAPMTRLVINLDNGPENHSRRTQFMYRLVEFAQKYEIALRLAYYPPYHSKYNPIERCWGILEVHWNGALLDSMEAVIKLTESMTWKGRQPVVALVTTAYQTGVSLTKAAMAEVETQLTRLAGLEKWFVDIVPATATRREA